MEPTKPLLDLPIRTAARWVSLAYLRDAADAAERLRGESDRMALNEFGVAIQELRGMLAAFRPALEDTVGARTRARLKGLPRLAERRRDLEAQIAWLDRLLADEPAASAECDPLRSRLAEGGRIKSREVARASARFRRVERRLARQLSSYEVRVDESEVLEPGTTAAALAVALHAAGRRVQGRLAAIATPVPEEAVRRARSSVRRLGTLLRPFQGELPGGDRLAHRLRVLEKVLDDLRELDLLGGSVAAYVGAAEATSPGLDLLGRRLRMRREETARELAARCAGSEGEAIVALVERLAAELGGSDLEIERKYLLDGMPELPEGAETLVVEQGWFGARPPERVRRTRGGEGVRHFRAIKHGRGVRRLELEEAISAEMFEALWPLTEGRRVYKTRFRVQAGDLCWEIDRFDDRELVLAEVEIPSVEHVADPPAWLAPRIVREVTEEGGYVNLNLAR